MSTATNDSADLFGIAALEEALAERYQARDTFALAMLADGSTQAEVASALGITRGRVAQLLMRQRQEERTATDKVRARARQDGMTARDLARQSAELAAHDQALRCERVTAQDGRGRSEEVRAFYGDERVAAGERVEARVSRRAIADGLSLAAEHRAYLDSLERAS